MLLPVPRTGSFVDVEGVHDDVFECLSGGGVCAEVVAVPVVIFIVVTASAIPAVYGIVRAARPDPRP